MHDDYWGRFKKEKYWIATEQEANEFIQDLNQFLETTLFSDKVSGLTKIDVIESLINDPEIFTSSVVKDIDYRRFYDGLIFCKLSNGKDLNLVFDKYWKYTNGWDKLSKDLIENFYQKLKLTDKKTLDLIYYGQ